jgi:aspartate carbamoyltransferase catalytic subunit
VDDYDGAAYFRQAANGVPVRMAVLALVTGLE